MRGAVARAARGVVRGRLARARASRGACMRRALLPVPVHCCSFAQSMQRPCRRRQWELLRRRRLVWLELLLPPRRCRSHRLQSHDALQLLN